MTTPQEYVASICTRRSDTEPVPFVVVSLGAWRPEIAKCHANVDRWVEANPGHQAVRGWISYISFGPAGEQLTAHSVVRKPDGTLIDITPVEPGQPRGGAFVEHQGESVTFFDMIKTMGHDIRCPSLDPEADAAELQAMLDELDDPVNGKRFADDLAQARVAFSDLSSDEVQALIDEAISADRKRS